MKSRRSLTIARCLRATAAAAALAALVPRAQAAPPSLGVPFAEAPPRVDAALDDPAWGDAAVIPELTLSIKPGGESRRALPVRVLVLWNEDALFVPFICRDDEIFTPYKHRDDPLYKGDVVEVFIDPVGDGRQCVELQVSPDNAVFDSLLLLTSEPVSDPGGVLRESVVARDFWAFPEWTMTGLRTAARRLEGLSGDAPTGGWLVDIAIPAPALLRRLGMEKFQPIAMRANFLRYDWPAPSSPAQERNLLAMNWAPVVDGCPHISPQAMGFLKLLPRGQRH